MKSAAPGSAGDSKAPNDPPGHYDRHSLRRPITGPLIHLRSCRGPVVCSSGLLLFMSYRMGYMDHARAASHHLLEDCMSSRADERECTRRAAVLDSDRPRWALQSF